MKKTITIGTEPVDCVVNAFTPVLYRQIFHKDFLVEMQTLTKLRSKKPEEFTSEDIELASEKTISFARITFVMKEQGTGKTVPDLIRLSEVDFYEWLSEFEPNTFEEPTLIREVLSLWKANSKDSSVNSKNQ